MAIATLSIDLVARLANIERDMGKAAQIAERNAKRMETAFAGVKTALGAIGGLFAVDQVGQWLKGVADSADALSKLSQRTGVAVDDLSALQYAASLNDASFSDLEQALKGLSNKMLEVQRGSKEAQSAFTALGIGVTTADGGLRDVDDVLIDIAEAFSKMEDGAEKSALANKLMEESGVRLIPMLNNGRTGLAGMRKEAEALGLIMDEKLAKASVEFNDNMEKLTQASSALGREIAGPLIESLANLTSQFVAARVEGDSFLESLDRALNGTGRRTGVDAAVADMQRLSAELERLDNQIAQYGDQEVDPFLTTQRGTISAQLAEAKRNYEQLSSAAAQAQARSAARTLTPSSQPSATTPRRGSTRLSEAQKQYEAIERQIEALNTQASTFGLSEKSATLYRLALDGATESQLRNAEVLLDEIATLQQYAAAQKRLDDLLGNTALEKQREDMQLLAGAFESGRISVEEYTKAVQEQLGTLQTDIERTTGLLDELGVEAAKNIQNAFADFLFDPFDEGLDGMLKSFGQVIQRMIAEAVAADMARYLFGDLVKGGSGGGMLGDILGGLGDFLPSFDGGGSTWDGPRIGGLDGKGGRLAVLHPNETVLDHTKGQRSASGGVTVIVAPGTPNEVRRAAGAGAREALSMINRAGRYA